MKFSFCGPTYQSQSPNAAADQCINWYPEKIETGVGNSPLVLYPSPGTQKFAQLASANIVGLDKALSGGTGNNVTALSLGPMSPAQPNEWFIYHINNSTVPTLNSGWAPFGIVNSFTQVSSVPVTANATFAAGGSADNVMASFLTKLGVAPTIANTNDVSSSTPPFPTNSFTVPLNPTTKGNVILVIFQASSSDGSDFPPAITDTQLNVYTLVTSTFSVAGSGASRSCALYVASGIAGGPCTLTITSIRPGGGFIGSGIAEVIELTPLGGAPAKPIRGLLTITGRTFCVAGSGFFEIFANGTFTQLGTVSNDSLLVTMAASSIYVLIGSAGFAYTFNLQTNAFAQIPPATFAGTVSRVSYSDGFFIVTITDSRRVYASAVEDATTWPGLSTTLVSLFPNNIISSITDHRELWLFSNTSTVVYEDTGASPFPFEPNPSAYIEQGCAAKFSPAKLDNTIFWLGADERGQGIVWRASGYTPSRVSTHAIELAFQSYSRIDDAIGYAFQDQGHSFYHLYFPTADKSWRYDTATNMWHQVGFWDPVIADYHAHHSQCHTFNFGRHLVGDWSSEIIYQMAINIYQDDFISAGAIAQFSIRRVRRAPHISKEQKRIRHKQLQVFLESGLGPQPPLLDGLGSARGPQGMLRWSDDSHTWSNLQTRDAGQAGQFKKRLIWRRLGVTRDRFYEFSVSDAIPWRLIDAYLDAEEGNGT